MGDTKILSMAAVIALLGLGVVVLFGPEPSIAPRDSWGEPASSSPEPVPLSASTSTHRGKRELEEPKSGRRADPRVTHRARKIWTMSLLKRIG